MLVLINQNKRVLAVFPEGAEIQYPDERWQIITVPDKDTIFADDSFNYCWDGEQLVYNPE